MHFKRFLKCSIGLLFLFLNASLFGQSMSGTGLYTDMLEQVLENLDGDVDLSELTERLRYYLEHPIDLNTANETSLASLLFLSPSQVASILRHREQSGLFISLLELQGIEGLDLQTIEKLLPFVSVSSTSALESLKLRQLVSENDQQLILRYARTVERQHGYAVVDTARSRYLGSADRYMVRYRLRHHDRLRLAINMEKDAGEPFFAERQRLGFDHYGISLHLKGKSWLHDLVLGDYAMQVGQGLVLWNGLSFGKGAMITASARQGVGLRSYTSMNEAGFLRGGSARFAPLKGLQVTPFLSWRKLSGNVADEDGIRIIKTLSVSGLHRTPNELRNKQQIDQYVYGVDINYSYNRIKMGLAAAHTRYSGEIAASTQLRTLDNFAAQSVTNLGINYQATYRNMYFFGEVAYQWQETFATVHGTILSLNPQFSVFVHYRNYHRRYYAPFSQALSEGSAVANENGIYAGLTYRLGRKIEWTSYVDQFRFPWLRYRVDAPSRGVDLFSQLSYIWYKVGRLSLRYRYRIKQENSDEPAAEHILADAVKDQIRLDFHYQLSKIWLIRSRVETVFFAKESRNELGRLIYQDIFWKPARSAMQWNLRFALFRTDSYDARLYAYENDVLYANSFPLYNGNGWRSYINVHYKIGRKIDSWARYSVTRYTAAETVGSGLDQSAGPIRSEIKVQLRYRW